MSYVAWGSELEGCKMKLLSFLSTITDSFQTTVNMADSWQLQLLFANIDLPTHIGTLMIADTKTLARTFSTYRPRLHYSIWSGREWTHKEYSYLFRYHCYVLTLVT